MAHLTSEAVESAIFYCGGQYEKCEVYRRLAGIRTGKEEEHGEKR